MQASFPDAAVQASPPAEHARTYEHSTGELVTAIVTGAEFHMSLVALAMRMLKAGTPGAQAILLLRGLMNGVPRDLRDTKAGARAPGRWQARYDAIPGMVGSAELKLIQDCFAVAATAAAPTSWGYGAITGPARAAVIRIVTSAMVRQGLHPEMVVDVAQAVNEKCCQPPLDASAVFEIFEHMVRDARVAAAGRRNE